MISAVIRVRNAATDLERCLSSIRRQMLPSGVELEIIVVDNESVDDSRAVARRHGALIVPISQAEFSWGRALNRGIAQAKGEIVLLLSSDATPADEFWMQQMVEPFVEPEVAIVYGRQLPYPDAPVDERVRLRQTFGTEPMALDRNEHAENPCGKGMLVSNACAAVRRVVWQEHPYDEETSGGEEGPFTCQTLRQGLRCLYQPKAVVRHSHRDSPWRYACREWEILHKNVVYSGVHLKKRILLRWWIGVAKRRLVNCLRGEVPLYYRIEGFVRLPIDVAACVIVGSLLFREKSRQRARQVFWR
jgi:glycosyltransferase involved in cell wall biosynthesis